MTEPREDAPLHPATTGRPPKVVALGGGHGLSASLAALKQLTPDVTAVVTVADDGGSSGRIRKELPALLPPGDLRMALVALAGGADAETGWPPLLQHRIGGRGSLSGHSVGNMVLAGLLELHPDPVEALAVAARLVGATGRVLPMSPKPLDLVADIEHDVDDGAVRVDRIQGQSAIADAGGRLAAIELFPVGAPACAPAVDAVREADLVVLGPGSWFTSVIPHLLVHELAAALVTTRARKVVVLNLVAQTDETSGFSPAEHLQVLRGQSRWVGGLMVDAVLADPSTLDPAQLADVQDAAAALGAEVVLADVRDADHSDRHDPRKLAVAYGRVLAP
ncbi:gluconeogenesis factor YvcK family protein [Jatrophihabitans sp. YIM 134969]